MAADVAELAARIAAEPGVTGIVLFGSGSRGELTQRSDLDFVVITRENERRAQEKRLERALGRNDLHRSGRDGPDRVT